MCVPFAPHSAHQCLAMRMYVWQYMLAGKPMHGSLGLADRPEMPVDMQFPLQLVAAGSMTMFAETDMDGL